MKEVLMAKPSLFSFEECLWFLNRNYDDCLHHITPDSITKAIEIDGEMIVFSLTQTGNYIRIKLESGNIRQALPEKLTLYVTDWLDLERDIQPFYNILQQHKSLDYMTHEFAGLRLIGIADLYEALCWCIIGQQINLTFAYTLKRRLVENFGSYMEINGIKHFVFPAPEVLAVLSVEELKQLQFSRQKAEYIIQLSQLFRDNYINKEKLLSLSTTEERRKVLTAIRGIGVWTANYVLMKTLRDLTCIPYGDIGLLNALTRHGLIKDRKDTAGIERLFDPFKGWESYLVFYLWRSLAVVDIGS